MISKAENQITYKINFVHTGNQEGHLENHKNTIYE